MEAKILKQIFVDTAFILAIVNKRDEMHSKAAELLPSHGPSHWITTDLVLYEVGNSLAKNSKPEAKRIITDFLESDGVEIIYASPGLFRRAFNLYWRYEDKTWGLVDCVSFIVMKDCGLTTALTNDKHFQQAGFTALMREG